MTSEYSFIDEHDIELYKFFTNKIILSQDIVLLNYMALQSWEFWGDSKYYVIAMHIKNNSLEGPKMCAKTAQPLFQHYTHKVFIFILNVIINYRYWKMVFKKWKHKQRIYRNKQSYPVKMYNTQESHLFHLCPYSSRLY